MDPMPNCATEKTSAAFTGSIGQGLRPSPTEILALPSRKVAPDSVLAMWKTLWKTEARHDSGDRQKLSAA